ncbi:ABC transporter permease subunit [Actinotalea caeni]|uniref:ABC transporter permease subunit n=1 Tax=Actinotalea caeni TaxID=1348467 RepID=UPI0012E13477|nr:ABC transporter permease subunit [Actinotalea caeni]
MIDRDRVRTVMRKDWLEVVRSPQSLAALLVVPAVFVVVLPTVVLLLARQPGFVESADDVRPLLDVIPAGLLPEGLDEVQQLVYVVVVFLLAPFFLLIPVMVASVTASSSVVGEKERRTIEGLLYTPLTDRELVLAKILGSVLPAVAITWLSFLVYTVLVNVLGWPLLGRLYFPTWTWAVIMLLVVPAIAFLGTSLVVAVSGRATTVQGAQGVAVLVVLPVVGLVVGQAAGVALLDVPVALVAAGVIVVLDVVLFRFAVGRFQRERVLTQL